MRMCECVCACVYVYMYVCVCDEHVCTCVMHMCVCVCMCVYVCTHVCGYVYLCEYICMCRPVARSGNRGVWKTNVDLTSERWPRWVARYEKGGWAVHFRADIRKVGGGGGGGGGAIRFRSITKSGGERCKLPHWGLGQSPRSFTSRDLHHISGP